MTYLIALGLLMGAVMMVVGTFVQNTNIKAGNTLMGYGAVSLVCFGIIAIIY